MKITLEPETDVEKKAMAEPLALTGCVRFAIAGLGEKSEKYPTGEFEQLHAVLPGDHIRIRGDLARLLGNLDLMAMQQTSVNGVLQANQILHQAQVQENIAQEVMANRNGGMPRLHRP
jgi:hypothetical protein